MKGTPPPSLQKVRPQRAAVYEPLLSRSWLLWGWSRDLLFSGNLCLLPAQTPCVRYPGCSKVVLRSLWLIVQAAPFWLHVVVKQGLVTVAGTHKKYSSKAKGISLAHGLFCQLCYCRILELVLPMQVTMGKVTWVCYVEKDRGDRNLIPALLSKNWETLSKVLFFQRHL